MLELAVMEGTLSGDLDMIITTIITITTIPKAKVMVGLMVQICYCLRFGLPPQRGHSDLARAALTRRMGIREVCSQDLAPNAPQGLTRHLMNRFAHRC